MGIVAIDGFAMTVVTGMTTVLVDLYVVFPAPIMEVIQRATNS